MFLALADCCSAIIKSEKVMNCDCLQIFCDGYYLKNIMNPKSLEARSRDDNPFRGMVIDDSEPLNSLKSRSPCPSCGKSRMYFCYSCYVPVSELKDRIPRCKLPVQVDIIKHNREIDGKSTAAHAALLAPCDVKIYTYPNIPEYEAIGDTVLLYPGTEAVTVNGLFENDYNSTYTEQMLANLPLGYNVGTLMTNLMNSSIVNKQKIYHVQKLPIAKVVLIDSTWNQSRGIFADKTLQRLPKVVLQNRPSQFWRHQKGSPRWYLSTIEALHQLMIELHINAWGRDSCYDCDLTNKFPTHNIQDHHPQCNPYKGQYDNLLYFFKHMYYKIHTLYKHEDMLAYKRPMI